MTQKAAVFGVAETIGKRKDQEDYVVWTDDVTLVDQGAPVLPRLTVIADGMGGHAAGNVASQTATKAFLSACLNLDPDDTDLLGKALDTANAKLAEKVAGDSALEGMGCTLIGVQLSERGDSFRWISVGDSLLLSVTGDGVHHLNEDHSFRSDVARIAEAGGDTTGLPAPNVLRSAVMGEPIPLVDDHSAWRSFAGGESLVLATDGLDTLSDEEIGAIVRAAPDAAAAAKALVKAVEDADKPRQDNTTVVVLRGPKDAPAGVSRRGIASTTPDDSPKKRGLSLGMLITMLVAGLLLGGAVVWAVIMLNRGDLKLAVLDDGDGDNGVVATGKPDDPDSSTAKAVDTRDREARAAQAAERKANADLNRLEAAGTPTPKPSPAPKPVPSPAPSGKPGTGGGGPDKPSAADGDGAPSSGEHGGKPKDAPTPAPSAAPPPGRNQTDVDTKRWIAHAGGVVRVRNL